MRMAPLDKIAQLIAPVAAVIGFLGLGLMYMGSSWPIIGDWKRDNPKAANQVVIGLLFVVSPPASPALITFAWISLIPDGNRRWPRISSRMC